MQFIKSDINLNFIGKRKLAFYFSMALIVISIVSLVFHGGPKLGIDFEGGTLIQVRFAAPANIDDIKSGLQTVGLEASTVQDFSEESANEYLVRTETPQATTQGFSTDLQKALEASVGSEAEMRRVEMVGPQVGQDLREKALLAMFYALLGITFYISGRFEFKWLASGGMGLALILAIYLFQVIGFSIPILIVAALLVTLVLFWFLDLRYAMGAIVALVHDVMITVGVFSILGLEFTLTSMTTLFVVVTLYLLGGGIIHDFAFALIVGVAIGTYSSLYVASPILLTWEQRRKK
jgi:preprotein translocase subunit SecF